MQCYTTMASKDCILLFKFNLIRYDIITLKRYFKKFVHWVNQLFSLHQSWNGYATNRHTNSDLLIMNYSQTSTNSKCTTNKLLSIKIWTECFRADRKCTLESRKNDFTEPFLFASFDSCCLFLHFTILRMYSIDVYALSLFRSKHFVIYFTYLIPPRSTS